MLSLGSFLRPSDIKMSIMFQCQSPKTTNATGLIQNDNDKLHKFNLGVNKSTKNMTSRQTY